MTSVHLTRYTHDATRWLLANKAGRAQAKWEADLGRRPYRYSDALRAMGYDGAKKAGLLADYKRLILKP